MGVRRVVERYNPRRSNRVVGDTGHLRAAGSNDQTDQPSSVSRHKPRRCTTRPMSTGFAAAAECPGDGRVLPGSPLTRHDPARRPVASVDRPSVTGRRSAISVCQQMPARPFNKLHGHARSTVLLPKPSRAGQSAIPIESIRISSGGVCGGGLG